MELQLSIYDRFKTLLHYTTSGSLHTSMISFCNKLRKEINWVKLNDMICLWQLEWYQHSHRLQTQNTDGRNKSCHKLISCPWNHCWSQVSPPLSFQSPGTIRGAGNEIRLHCAVGRNTIRKLGHPFVIQKFHTQTCLCNHFHPLPPVAWLTAWKFMNKTQNRK